MGGRKLAEILLLLFQVQSDRLSLEDLLLLQILTVLLIRNLGLKPERCFLLRVIHLVLDSLLVVERNTVVINVFLVDHLANAHLVLEFKLIIFSLRDGLSILILFKLVIITYHLNTFHWICVILNIALLGLSL